MAEWNLAHGYSSGCWWYWWYSPPIFPPRKPAFSSLNRIRLKSLAEGGDKKAALALSLEENYDKLLSTILIGNNIVNIASASIATVVFVAFLGDLGVTVSTVVMTVVVLIFGEISPKAWRSRTPRPSPCFPRRYCG